MATTELGGLITRTTVILEKPADWEEWIFLRKDSADRHHLWSMVDPDLDQAALEKLEEPAAVEPEHYHDETEVDTGVVLKDMTTEEFQRYQQAERNYDRTLARYTIKRKALNDFTQEIGRTISRRHIHLIQSDNTTYARLKKLKKHFCPSTAERELQLIAKYRQLQSRPRNNIDSWLEEWLHIVRMCEAVCLPDVTSPRAQRDFLLAVKGLEDTWATTQQATLFRAQLNAQPIPTLDDLVAKFAMYWRSTRPVASSLGTFATLGINQSFDRRADGTETQTNNKDRRLECKCGLTHRFKDCWYLGGKGKPQGWTPKPDIQEKFSKAIESQSPIGRAMKAALKANAGTTALTVASSTPRRFDDRSPTIEDLDSFKTNKAGQPEATARASYSPV
ncbi:hypothetical protein EJ07DRAFT_159227 [Lizonia empirigonia]|nr:hypothetical protein EJ07DRAFT_159227 [Lizonia empirigonia]